VAVVFYCFSDDKEKKYKREYELYEWELWGSSLYFISGWNSCKGEARLGKADLFQTKWLNLSSAAWAGRDLQVF